MDDEVDKDVKIFVNYVLQHLTLEEKEFLTNCNETEFNTFMKAKFG